MARFLKVLMVRRRLDVSGRTAYTLGLAGALSAGRHTVGIVTEGGVRTSEARAMGLTVREAPELFSFWRAFLKPKATCKEVEGFGADLVHIQSADALWAGKRLARRLGRPAVVTMHREYIRGFRPVGSEISAVIAVGESLSENLVNRAGVSLDKIHIVPNGVDVDAFAAPAPDSGGEPERPFVVTGMGRLIARRGFQYLVRAAAQVLSRPLAGNRQVKFLVLGDGPERRSLVGLAEKLGIREHMAFPGELTDVRSALAATDIFVNPALEEALGLPVLEAMATGRPVIASAVGGAFHLVEEGASGFVVPPADSAAIADRIRRLIENDELRLSMGKRGQEIARERFSLAIEVNSTLAVYREVGRQYAEKQVIRSALAEAERRGGS